MGLFRRKRRSPSPAPRTEPVTERTDPVAERTGGKPWLDHGAADGDRVCCGRCDTVLTVTLQKQTAVAVSHDGALDGMALICTGCGRWLCAPCALAASDNPYLPKCDRCQDHVTVPMAR